MRLNRFWGSVWEVVQYLAAVGLLNVILLIVSTGFGLLQGTTAMFVSDLVSVIAVAAGTLLYLDWRWNWQAEHIGLSRNPASAAGMWLLGLAGGAVVAFLAHAASAMLAGGPFSVSFGLDARALVEPLTLVIALLQAFVIELVFRAAAISRFQADMAPREVLIAAPFVPVLWLLINAMLGSVGMGLGVLPSGLRTISDLASTVALALLFIRTDSLWLTAGLRMGFVAAVGLLTLQVSQNGSFAVWGVIALVLLALEWFKQQRMPRRMPGQRGGGGRTIRGPWGPH